MGRDEGSSCLVVPGMYVLSMPWTELIQGSYSGLLQTVFTLRSLKTPTVPEIGIFFAYQILSLLSRKPFRFAHMLS